MHGLHWLQINVQLRTGADNSIANLHGLFEIIFPVVFKLKRTGQLRCFFFARKEPGLRLRFGFRGLNGEIMKQIEHCFKKATLKRIVLKSFPSSYEPEVFKMGGPEAMAVSHAQFFTDSVGWWRWEKLMERGRARIGAMVLSTCVLNDLFARLLEGPEEVWDVWRKIEALHGPMQSDPPVDVPRIRFDNLLNKVSSEERRVLTMYQAANVRFARKFQKLHRQGKLLYGYRLVLPHVALHHWNRYGFSLKQRSAIWGAMLRTWGTAVHPPVA